MRYAIASHDKAKFLTTDTFPTVYECMKEVDNKLAYWKKVLRKNKDLPKTRRNQWKKCIFVEIQWEREVWGDTEMVIKQETSKSNRQSQSKALKEYDQRRIQDKVDLSIKNSSKFKKYAKSR